MVAEIKFRRVSKNEFFIVSGSSVDAEREHGDGGEAGVLLQLAESKFKVVHDKEGVEN